jgi:hypothetical protein
MLGKETCKQLPFSQCTFIKGNGKLGQGGIGKTKAKIGISTDTGLNDGEANKVCWIFL